MSRSRILPWEYVGSGITGFHLDNCPRGDSWRNLDFRRSMMVKDVSNFTNAIWGVGYMLEYMCAGFHIEF